MVFGHEHIRSHGAPATTQRASAVASRFACGGVTPSLVSGGLLCAPGRELLGWGRQ